MSQGCKAGPLLKDLSFEAFTWHLSTPRSGAPGRNISPPFPSLGQLKGEIRAGKRALPSPALKDASTLQLAGCFSGLWSPSKAPNPSAASHGHHGNPALALCLVLNEDLAPNFVFLDRGGRNHRQSLCLPARTARQAQQEETQQFLPSARSQCRSPS